MPPMLTMSVKGGNFRKGGSLQSVAQARLGNPILQAGQGLAGTLAAHTPRRTGHLAAGWGARPVHGEGSRLISEVTNPVVYARSVNRRGKSAGYVDAGLAAGTPEARAALRQGAIQIKGDLWDKAAP